MTTTDYEAERQAKWAKYQATRRAREALRTAEGIEAYIGAARSWYDDFYGAPAHPTFRRIEYATWAVQTTINYLGSGTIIPVVGIQVHNTVIVAHLPSRVVILDTGGWWTTFTSGRLSTYSPFRFHKTGKAGARPDWRVGITPTWHDFPDGWDDLPIETQRAGDHLYGWLPRYDRESVKTLPRLYDGGMFTTDGAACGVLDHYAKPLDLVDKAAARIPTGYAWARGAGRNPGEHYTGHGNYRAVERVKPRENDCKRCGQEKHTAIPNGGICAKCEREHGGAWWPNTPDHKAPHK